MTMGRITVICMPKVYHLFVFVAILEPDGMTIIVSKGCTGDGSGGNMMSSEVNRGKDFSKCME